MRLSALLGISAELWTPRCCPHNQRHRWQDQRWRQPRRAPEPPTATRPPSPRDDPGISPPADSVVLTVRKMGLGDRGGSMSPRAGDPRSSVARMAARRGSRPRPGPRASGRPRPYELLAGVRPALWLAALSSLGSLGFDLRRELNRDDSRAAGIRPARLAALSCLRDVGDRLGDTRIGHRRHHIHLRLGATTRVVQATLMQASPA